MKEQGYGNKGLSKLLQPKYKGGARSQVAEVPKEDDEAVEGKSGQIKSLLAKLQQPSRAEALEEEKLRRTLGLE